VLSPKQSPLKRALLLEETYLLNRVHLHLRMIFELCSTVLKWENRGRRPRLSFKGGEEKSPYCPNFNIMPSNLLDGERTITLLLSDDLQGPLSPALPKVSHHNVSQL